MGRAGQYPGSAVGHVTADGGRIATYLPGKEILCSTPISSAVG
ncbi:hypothetical protein SLI_7278 [Streptomyces lividans 1326]|uniref:Uncharacterized protein n=1 Tax=Streptomyces lividans 1326 TaxID=1200984 RepID=A0A7U9E1Q4_STRLI|nr:hypothetical protein SLI_7278 [Streptomyces lividans 1326]